MRTATKPTLTPAGCTSESEVRSKAEAVLACLLAAKQQCDEQLTKLHRTDPMKQVKGRSSLDDAIDSTRRLIAELDQVAADLRAKPACEVEVRVNAGAWRRGEVTAAV